MISLKFRLLLPLDWEGGLSGIWNPERGKCYMESDRVLCSKLQFLNCRFSGTLLCFKTYMHATSICIYIKYLKIINKTLKKEYINYIG